MPEEVRKGMHGEAENQHHARHIIGDGGRGYIRFGALSRYMQI